MPASGDERGSRRTAVVGVGLASVAFVGVALAATGGPVPLAVEQSDGWQVRIPDIGVGRPSQESAEVVERPDRPDSVGSDVVQVLTQVAVLLVVATLAYLVCRAVVRAVRLASADALDELPAEQAPPTGTRAMTEAVDESIEALAGGAVDDVIVACWVRLEDAAAAGGNGRRPSETPAELAVRVLTAFRAPPDAIDRLLTLYHAARYSRHTLDEADRAAAIVALGDVRAAIVVGAT